MAFSFTADHQLLSWTSSNFLKGSRAPNSIKHPLLQLRARLTHPYHGFCTASFIDRSKTGWLSQKHEPLFSFCFKRNGGNLRFRVVAQAGRSKPRFPQPIRPRRQKRINPPSGRQPDPGGNIRRRKSIDTQEQEPYVRHPDDYYKFGPFGPYDYKADVVGTLIPVTSFTQDFAVMWSTVRDLEHQEQIDIEDACITYHNRVRLFDESVGLKFFYVFVRLPYHVVREPPWRQWTLVSEITVESGEDLDKETLFSRLNNSIRNKITKHTAWFRPDLIYVRPKRRHYQLRFEPELEFIGELQNILYKSAGEPDEAESYYGVFCRFLGLDVNAGPEDVTSKYEASSEEIKLACLEHLLTNHPIQLLHSIPYPNRSMWTAKQSTGKSNMTNTGEISMQKDMAPEEEGLDGGDDDGKDEDNWESEEDKEAESDDDWDNLDDDEIEARLSKGISDLTDDEPARADRNELERDDIDSDDEEVGGSEGDVYAGDPGVSNVRYLGGTSMLKAAARPYTYVNFIREMVLLREMLLQSKMQSRSNVTASQ